MAAIEFRSYNAGTVTIEATSTGLTAASVTITVLHVDDATVTSIPAISRIAAGGPGEMVLKMCGNRIAIPKTFSGKKVEVSLFDVHGRLIGQMLPGNARVIERHAAAEEIIFARIKVIK
jgi:hypothetical protein